MKSQSEKEIYIKNCISADQSQYSYRDCSQSQQLLCKITITLQKKVYKLPLYSNSSIKELGLKFIVKLYQNLNEKQFQDNFVFIHEKICQILAHKVHQTIKAEQNNKSQKWKKQVLQIIRRYQQKEELSGPKIHSEKISYFTKNYKETLNKPRPKQYLQQVSSKYSLNQKCQNESNLYEKALKSLQKRKFKQKQRIRQKTNFQKQNCTFHPNIQVSQRKLKSKQRKCVFDRLYQNASEVKFKKLFKYQKIKKQQEKHHQNICKFTPDINECSKQIMKLKFLRQFNGQSIAQTSNRSQKINNISTYSTLIKQDEQQYVNNHLNSSYKTNITKKISAKIFSSLSDSNFYENRFNKTLQKLKINKQNQFSFQPQLSEGTKKLTKNYPSLQKRMEIYEKKKQQDQRSSHKNELMNQKIKNNRDKMTKISGLNVKNSRKYKVKTQAYDPFELRQINKDFNTTINKNNYKISSIETQVLYNDNQFSSQITPKKLNLDKQYEFKQESSFSKLNRLVSNLSNQQIYSDIQFTQQQAVINLNKKAVNYIFNQIFLYLTMRQVQITYHEISSNNKIPGQIRLIFKPLTQQLKQMETSLDMEQFCWSLQNLYMHLPNQKKMLLLNWGLNLTHQNKKIREFPSVLMHVKTQDSVFQLIE